MPLDFATEENTGRFILRDLPVTRLSAPSIDVCVGQALVGRVVRLGDGLAELFLLQPLKESGRKFRLDEVLDDDGRIASIELIWI